MGIGAWAAGLIFRWLTGPATSKNLKQQDLRPGSAEFYLRSSHTALALAFSNEGFVAAAWTIFLSNLPVMFIEGILTAIVVVYIKRTDAGVFDAKQAKVILSLLVPLLSVSTGSTAFAHRLNVFAYPSGSEICVEASLREEILQKER